MDGKKKKKKKRQFLNFSKWYEMKVFMICLNIYWFFFLVFIQEQKCCFLIAEI